MLTTCRLRVGNDYADNMQVQCFNSHYHSDEFIDRAIWLLQNPQTYGDVINRWLVGTGADSPSMPVSLAWVGNHTADVWRLPWSHWRPAVGWAIAYAMHRFCQALPHRPRRNVQRTELAAKLMTKQPRDWQSSGVTSIMKVSHASSEMLANSVICNLWVSAKFLSTNHHG